MIDAVALLSRVGWFAGARRDALNGSGDRQNRLRGLARDACGRIFVSVGFRGDAWGGLSDAPGSVSEHPGAVFELAAADFAARPLLSDVGRRGMILGHLRER